MASALTAPVAAQAQGTVGVTGGNTVVIEQGGGIIAEQRPAFREYVVSQRVPPFTIPDRVVVGTTLPEAGVTFYDVPGLGHRSPGGEWFEKAIDFLDAVPKDRGKKPPATRPSRTN